MFIFSNFNDLLDWRASISGCLGFIPTMGALHEGHTSLIRESRQNNDVCVVSIFVNPLQFGAQEDLSKYPRTLEDDLNICRTEKVDAVFLPELQQIYPNQELITKVRPYPQLTNCLCGLSRSGHFEGVLTIVLKLFNLVRPHKAYFGEKDYQQYLLIKKMSEDFNLNIEIIPMPIIRADSGLALSSRNKYLSLSEQKEASKLYIILKKAKSLILQNKSIKSTLESLKEENAQIDFEYFEARHPESLELTKTLPAHLFIAAQIGPARLIDNLRIV